MRRYGNEDDGRTAFIDLIETDRGLALGSVEVGWFYLQLRGPGFSDHYESEPAAVASIRFANSRGL